MARLGMTLAACSLLVVACANAEDDSWNGAAGNQILESEGGGGSQPSLGGSPSNGGNHSSEGGSPSETGPTTVTSGPTTTTTGGGSCDVGSCDSCQGCAMEGPCAASADACFNDSQCYALIECLNACVDDACFNACANSYPSGMTLYNAVGECVFCDACFSTCGAC